MKIVKYVRLNTLKHFFEGDTIRRFMLTPSIELSYDSQGFFSFGHNDNEWCKELSVEVGFLIFYFSITFFWGFYTKNN